MAGGTEVQNIQKPHCIAVSVLFTTVCRLVSLLIVIILIMYIMHPHVFIVNIKRFSEVITMHAVQYILFAECTPKDDIVRHAFPTSWGYHVWVDLFTLNFDIVLNVIITMLFTFYKYVIMYIIMWYLCDCSWTGSIHIIIETMATDNYCSCIIIIKIMW